MYQHSRKTRKRYVKINHADVTFICNFCDGLQPEQIIHGTDHFWLVRNRVPYDTWEFHKVLEHLLIVPKRHVARLAEFTEPEQLEYMELISQHETKDFSIYARSSNSPRRSAHHQHTHLLRIGDTVARGGVYMKKPYINISV